VDPKRHECTDVALSLVWDDEEEDLVESPIRFGPHSLLHIEKHKTMPVPARMVKKLIQPRGI